MECFIVIESDIDQSSQSLVLRGEEAHHAIRVLRLREGENLLATTLHGFCYRAKLASSEQVSKNEWIAHCTIDEILPEYNEPSIDIQLIQGITQQQSKFEEITEKVTELGISSIVPIYTKRVEKRSINSSRLEKIIQSACKQSRRARMPKLYEAMNFSEALINAKEEGRRIILLHESAPLSHSLSKAIGQEKTDKISLCIGPEGGFDEAEVLLATDEYGASAASLGKRRLRAETAAISAVAIAMAESFSS